MAGSGSITPIRYDLAHFAQVTSIISTTVFICSGLAGFGDSEFIGYSAYVQRKSTGTGAAPQGQSQAVTASVGATGQITIAGAFTQPLLVGDEILLLHPSQAGGSNLHGLTPVANSVVANWNTGEQTVCVIGSAGARYKVQSLIVDITATAGAITLRMYISVNGVLRLIFPPTLATTFTVGTNAPGVALINGTYGIANALTVTAQSALLADNGTAISYEYFLEQM